MQISFILVSLENITTDLVELNKGMELTKKEYVLRQTSPTPPVILADFLRNSEEKLLKLRTDTKTAQVCNSNSF